MIDSHRYSISKDSVASYGAPLSPQDRCRCSGQPSSQTNKPEETHVTITEEARRNSLLAQRLHPDYGEVPGIILKIDELQAKYEANEHEQDTSEEKLIAKAVAAFKGMSIKETLAQPIELLGIHSQCLTYLTNAGYYTVGSVANATIKDLLSINNFGEKYLRRIFGRLKAIGLFPANAEINRETIRLAMLEKPPRTYKKKTIPVQVNKSDTQDLNKSA